jgi:hypothetical protein
MTYQPKRWRDRRRTELGRTPETKVKRPWGQNGVRPWSDPVPTPFGISNLPFITIQTFEQFVRVEAFANGWIGATI